MCDSVNISMLYIVSTPIGNLQDITARALEILRAVPIVIMESPQDSLRLLNVFEIKGKKIIKYNDRNKEGATEEIMEALRNQDAAYISSAGTPGISDPGADLVKEARETGIEVRIIPGPSAVVSAIAASGIRAREFTFISFPPKKTGQLKNLYQRFRDAQTVLVFFESTHRIKKTIEILNEITPDAYVCVAKEMTKLFERYLTGTPAEVLEQLTQDAKTVKGEFTVVIDFSK